MDFFGKVGETLANVGKEAGDKAKNLAEIASLKNQIHSCEDVIKKNYMEIGKLYYDNFGTTPEAMFDKQCNAIKNALDGKAALEAQVDGLKNL